MILICELFTTWINKSVKILVRAKNRVKIRFSKLDLTLLSKFLSLVSSCYTVVTLLNREEKDFLYSRL